MRYVLMIILMFVALTMGSCYVPMPSVGVRSTPIKHTKRCVHTSGGSIKCEHTQTYVRY